jgi:hypothetical protein
VASNKQTSKNHSNKQPLHGLLKGLHRGEKLEIIYIAIIFMGIKTCINKEYRSYRKSENKYAPLECPDVRRLFSLTEILY